MGGESIISGVGGLTGMSSAFNQGHQASMARFDLEKLFPKLSALCSTVCEELTSTKPVDPVSPVFSGFGGFAVADADHKNKSPNIGGKNSGASSYLGA